MQLQVKVATTGVNYDLRIHVTRPGELPVITQSQNGVALTSLAVRG